MSAEADQPTRVRLARDWDVPLQPPERDKEPVGHFVGRDHELALLTNELLRGPRRSILVSGYRGVGKTSLVYKALAQVYAADKDERFLPILLNAAQLGADSKDGTIAPEEILKNLVRRLYTTTRYAKVSPALRDRISLLYEKAVARDFAESVQERLESAKKSETTRTMDAKLDAAGAHVGLWLGSFGAALALALTDPFPSGLFDEIAPLIAAAPLPLAITFGVSFSRSRSATRTAQSVAERAYSFDNSVSNLEFDLEEIHSLLASEGRTAIYVIDELDKLKVEEVVEVLKFYKHLFTLSAATFIFIGGEELGARFADPPELAEGSGSHGSSGGAIYRPAEYTYFRSQYFVSRPNADDIRIFLRHVTIVDSPDHDTDSEFRDFEDILIFDARGDYFDLIHQLRDEIDEFEENLPVIVLGTLSLEERRHLAIERALRVVFEGKYQVSAASRWRENEMILRALYDSAHAAAEAFAGSELDDDTGDTIVASARRDLMTVLHRMEMIEIVSAADQEIRGTNVAIRRFRCTGTSPTEPPGTLDFRSEIESRFVAQYERLVGRLRMVYGIRAISRGGSVTPNVSSSSVLDRLAEWGFDARENLATANRIYGGLTRSLPREAFSRDELDTAQNEVSGIEAGFAGSSHSVVAAALAESAPRVTVSNASVEPGFFATTGLDGFANEVRHLPHSALRSESEKELLIFSELDPGIVKRAQGPLRNNAATHRVLVVGPGEQEYSRRPKGLRTLELTEQGHAIFARNVRWVTDWLA